LAVWQALGHLRVDKVVTAQAADPATKQEAAGQLSSFNTGWRKRKMGSFEQHCDPRLLGMLTEEERDQLRELCHQLDSKFDEIVSLIKRRLGCSEADAYEEAQQAIDRWNADVETFGKGWSSSLSDPIQILLRDHHSIGEAILDIEDQAHERTHGTEE
jgi:hypothetical protein